MTADGEWVPLWDDVKVHPSLALKAGDLDALLRRLFEATDGMGETFGYHNLRPDLTFAEAVGLIVELRRYREAEA